MRFRTRNSWLGLGLGLVASLASIMIAASGASAQQKVLRAVLHADVRTLDPIWTTQTIAGIHAMLVYDTLFGNDDDLVPQPQMVGKYAISEDKLTYTFTLRDGLKFHDGSPVATKDVIASLKRDSACSPSSTSWRRPTTRPSA
jgi:peptide/nickel transport system substrate-binding protein